MSVSRYAHYGFDASHFPQTLTAPGATNTKGAWLELTSSTAFDAHGVIIQMRASSTTSRTYLADMGIGGSGSEVVKIPNLFVTMGGSSHSCYYHFPGLFIPAGSRISGRYQSTSTSSPICRMGVSIYQSASPITPLFRVRAYGAVTADSGGTTITSGTSGSKGSWTEITSSTDIDIKHLIVANSHANSDYSLTAGAYSSDVAIGGSGSEELILSNLVQTSDTTFVFPITFGTFPVSIPAGTRLSLRSAFSGTPADARDAIIYGLG